MENKDLRASEPKAESVRAEAPVCAIAKKESLMAKLKRQSDDETSFHRIGYVSLSQIKMELRTILRGATSIEEAKQKIGIE